mmetsp:Transcript_795/g.1692  ORF Transcript_795/g.1692 Transcript_795/m.1692 type:complete len:275 (+) Transcript_795:103-927(+)
MPLFRGYLQAFQTSRSLVSCSSRSSVSLAAAVPTLFKNPRFQVVRCAHSIADMQLFKPKTMKPLSNKPQKLRGVIFDMDGTLTEPYLDIAEMKRRCGITSGDILDVIGSWSAEDQKQANKIIYEMECDARLNMTLMPGVADLCRFLDERGIPRGILTRNVMESVDHLHKEHVEAKPFLPAVTRGFTPYKPHPAGLMHICDVWRVDPSEIVMVGDSAKDDVVVGNRAGSATILLDTTDRYREEDLHGELLPNFVVTHLDQIVPLLKEHFAFGVDV